MVLDLLAASAEESGCASFGLLLAECRTFASLGAMSLLLEHQPNVRTKIEAMVRFVRYFNDVLVMSITDDGECAIVGVDISDEIPRPEFVEYSVALTFRALSEVSRGLWRPDRIYFKHSAPDDLADYRRVLQCPVEFDADFNGMTCRSAILDVPNPRADALMVRYAEHLLGLVSLENIESSIAEHTRHAIHLLMPDGRASLEHVADTLGLHPRRLQRMLEKEGESFASLINAVRREFALRYLGSSHHSIAAVSGLAGYSNQSAFTRWFAQEFGESPAAWRAGAFGGGDGGARASAA
jgi:AraC-like DNA-binding protein